VENRYLLVFDTSSAMKRRLPAEGKSIDALFQITLNGKLHSGDSIGVWTFNRDLHMGDFPQQDWSDDAVNTFPPEIEGFLKKQRYAKDTRFDGLIPTLNEVVQKCPRLTTIIFCDGDGQVSGIPGADGINSSFKQHGHLMEKSKMPFVIVLRSQFDSHQVGHYVGCTISSASDIILPQFPPMPPPPPPPAPVPAKVVPQPPPPVVQPLIVIGTQSETTPPPMAAPTAPPPQAQPAPTPKAPPVATPVSPPQTAPPAVAPSPSPAIPMAQTNEAPPPAAEIEQTNPVVPPPAQATSQPIPPAPIAATPTPPENSGMGRKGLLAAGAGIFIVVVAIIYLFLRRSRGRDSSSLITESLKKR
jgi:hypothetical protein